MSDVEHYPNTVQDLLDREAIRDCLYRYCHGIDRRDQETLRGCYWPDGTDDHVSFSGNAHEFIDVIWPFLESLRSSTHFLGNILLRVHGDRAHGETYWQVFHREPGQDGRPDYDYLAGGRYLDVFEKRDGEWRILTRRLIRDHYQVIEGTGDWEQYPRPPAGEHGSQKETDPVRKLFGVLGGALPQ
ncbi:nuclear transport factor 2 family protein [Nakamurella leprariae]|uniref:Nuclear transport factor 2 family protein n=1 Tax=Nakamurella leprariae TaxID=2803911 RepID=A0A938YFT3_9ACTN|nr:nuclear transport factor 2 family protein [Nakamurella leprariae]MBM9468741.1 nuclear transport factor 2 family protein [Nakamurella leprariae]